MANPIKSSDIIYDDGAYDAALAKIGQIETAIDSVHKRAQELRKVNAGANAATDNGRETIQQAANEIKQLQRAQEALTASRSQAGKELVRLSIQRKNANKINKLSIEQDKLKKGSLEFLDKQLQINILKLAQMSKAEQANTKEGVKLTSQNERLAASIEKKTKARQVSIPPISKIMKAELALTQAQSNEAVELERLSDLKRKAIRINKLKARVANAEKDQLSALKAQYELNIITLSKYSKEQILTTKSLQILAEETKNLKDEVDDFGESVGKKPLSRLLGDLEEVPGATEDAGKGVGGLSKSFKGLLGNPVVLVISLIVAGLSALFNAFKQSEKGARLMDRATASLAAVMDVVAIAADKLAEGIEFAFSNPKEAVQALGEAIKRSIVNRLLAIPKLAESFKTVFVASLGAIANEAKLKFADVPIIGSGIDKEQVKKNLEEYKEEYKEEVREGLKDLGVAAIQFSTGADEEDQKRISNGFSSLSGTINKATEENLRFLSAQKDAAKNSAALRIQIAQINKEYELQNQIANDTTQTLNTQQEAAARAAELAEKRGNLEVKLAQINLGLISQEISLRRSANKDYVDLLDKRASAVEALRQAETQLETSVSDARRTGREALRDDLEQDLDFFLDITDKRTAANRSLINDENLTFEQRRKLLDDTVKLNEQGLEKQLDIISQFSDKEVDFSSLIGETDLEVLNERTKALGLDEIQRNRLLEVLRDQIDVQAELRDETTKLARAEEEARIERIENRFKALEEAKELSLEAFEDEQDLRRSEFALIESTEKEKADFEIQLEIEKNQKILELNKEFLDTIAADQELSNNRQLDNTEKLSEAQIATIKNNIEKLRNDLESVEPPKIPDNFLELVFPALGDEERGAIQSAADFIKNQLNGITEARIKAADEAVNQSQREIDAAQSALDNQLQLQSIGAASRVEDAQRELAEAKANQEKALKQRQKAQRDQIKLDTVLQGSNLITAITKVLATVSFPFNLLAVGTMLAAFTTAKVQAIKATRREFGKGGYDVLGGGLHGSGNDTFIGIGSTGTADYGEKDEGRAIYNRRATKHYGKTLPGLTNAINNLELESWLNDYLSTPAVEVIPFEHRISQVTANPLEMLQKASAGIPFSFNQSNNTDTSRMEFLLSDMNKKLSRSETVLPNGDMVIRDGNMTEYITRSV